MIYCVEDDESIRQLMIYALQANGFSARGFAGGDSFFAAIKSELPKLVLLDVMLPGESGISILKRLRSAPMTKTLPVVMVSAKGSEFDKVTGLDNGADDYLAKPFGVMELVSRVKAVLRRTSSESPFTEITTGPLHMNVDRHLVLVDGKEVQLTRIEFSLLRYLMENAGVVISRDKLLQEIWGYDYPGETRTVDVHIRSLRQKLGDHAQLIDTVRGFGYRIGEVK